MGVLLGTVVEVADASSVGIRMDCRCFQAGRRRKKKGGESVVSNG